MKTCQMILIVALGLAVLGCESTVPSQGAVSSSQSMAEGRFVTVEEGFLVLRLPNGQTEEFMFTDTDSMNKWIKAGGISLSDAPFLSGGRSCRVHFKKGMYEDVEGDTQDVLEVTQIEWL